MKATLTALLAAALAAVLVAPLLAFAPKENEKGQDKGRNRVPAPVKVLDDAVQALDLTAEQQKQYQKIYKQHLPTIRKQSQSQQSIFTPEQKQQRRAAVEKGKADGLKGKKLQQFVQAQVEFTPEQQKQFTDGQVELLKCQQQFRQEIVQILTPEQQQKLPPIGGKKGQGKQGKPDARKQPKPPAEDIDVLQ